MQEIFPELTNLKGGKKQVWVSNHLELVWSVTNEAGFDKAKEIFHMKDSTLISALQRFEKSSHPAVTNGLRAIKKAQYVESLAYDITKRLNALQDKFERSQQATVAALDMIERVLLMLRLSLTGADGEKPGRSDFRHERTQIYVM